MAVTEESRYQLFQQLEQLVGSEGVSTLMELLPPVGWADVATKHDLDNLRSALDARIGALDAKIDATHGTLDAKIDATHRALSAKIEREGVQLRAEVFREQRNQTLAIIGANTTITALLLAAFQLV